MRAIMPATFLVGRWPLLAAAVLALNSLLPALPGTSEARLALVGLAQNFLLPLLLMAAGEWAAWLGSTFAGRAVKLPLEPRFTALSCAASATLFVGLGGAHSHLLALITTPLAALYLEAHQCRRAPAVFIRSIRPA